jgi:hypothetical protein
MRTIVLSGICFATVLFTGCARSRVTTEIKSGGAWSRTVALTGQEKKEGQMDMGGSVEDAFAAPTGDGWKSHAETKDADKTVTYEKVFAAGAVSTADLAVKGDEGKVSLVNVATVKMVAPKRYEYRETLRWTGPPSKGMQVKPEDLAELKAALPKALATDTNAQAIANKTAALAVPLLFGPGDPLLAIGLLHPDLAEHKASQRIGAVILKALQEQFGDKMTEAERRAVALKLIATTFAKAKPSKPDPSAGPPSGKGSGLTPLMFIVKSGGKVISSNGEVDDLTGEVYWALFPEAASLQPVVLTAVIEIP